MLFYVDCMPSSTEHVGMWTCHDEETGFRFKEESQSPPNPWRCRSLKSLESGFHSILGSSLMSLVSCYYITSGPQFPVLEIEIIVPPPRVFGRNK